MILFRKENNLLILIYQPSSNETEWINKIFEKGEALNLKRTFTLRSKDLYISDSIGNNADGFDYNDSIEFVIGELENDYYRIDQNILGLNHGLFLYKGINLKIASFISYTNIPIFQRIDDLVKEDIYIGGDNINAIPEDDFNKLLRTFPNSYEVKKYAEARLSAILRNYLDTAIDGELKYRAYMNKKVSRLGTNLSDLFLDNEIFKYSTILDKLYEMLKNEDSYNEKQWQKEILQIILLLFPKYIYVFPEVDVKDTYNDKLRRLDYLLIDSCGNTDIVEIKKPFNNSIVTKAQYRDNYIPMRELSGTVMQIEKYIFYLNKWGKNGEKTLTQKYKNKLPENFQIQITNPSGIIVMGREEGLTRYQLQDFEIIKRKFKNIIDIITYDDLIKRLKFTIDQLKKK